MRRDTRTYVRRQANWFKPATPNLLVRLSSATLDGIQGQIERWMAVSHRI